MVLLIVRLEFANNAHHGRIWHLIVKKSVGSYSRMQSLKIGHDHGEKLHVSESFVVKHTWAEFKVLPIIQTNKSY